MAGLPAFPTGAFPFARRRSHVLGVSRWGRSWKAAQPPLPPATSEWRPTSAKASKPGRPPKPYLIPPNTPFGMHRYHFTQETRPRSPALGRVKPTAA